MEFRPALVIFSGLPFTGKTTLSRKLAQRSNFVHFDSDPYRMQIVGSDVSLPDKQEAEVMVESYRRMHKDGLANIRAGKPVSLAATYWRPVYKPLLRDLISQLEVSIRVFELRIDDSQVETRVAKRLEEGDPSDIKTLEQYLAYKADFDPITIMERHFINTNPPLEESFHQVLRVLQDLRINKS